MSSAPPSIGIRLVAGHDGSLLRMAARTRPAAGHRGTRFGTGGGGPAQAGRMTGYRGTEIWLRTAPTTCRVTPSISSRRFVAGTTGRPGRISAGTPAPPTVSSSVRAARLGAAGAVPEVSAPTGRSRASAPAPAPTRRSPVPRCPDRGDRRPRCRHRRGPGVRATTSGADPVRTPARRHPGRLGRGVPGCRGCRRAPRTTVRSRGSRSVG